LRPSSDPGERSDHLGLGLTSIITTLSTAPESTSRLWRLDSLGDRVEALVEPDRGIFAAIGISLALTLAAGVALAVG
jgi:hypothetical protein